jgi:hypothetical protein
LISLRERARSLPRIVLVLLPIAWVAQARADVIGEIASCAPWEDASFYHGSITCSPRVCRSDAQCSGGHCYEVRPVCVVTEPAARGRTRDRVVGVCGTDGTCAVGACIRVGTCNR